MKNVIVKFVKVRNQTDMRTFKERLMQVDRVYKLIYNLNKDFSDDSYSVDYNGFICVRKYEEEVWAVEWEEYNYQGECKDEVLEFTNAYKAAECFVELCFHEPVPYSHCWLGDKLEEFKRRYKNES